MNRRCYNPIKDFKSHNNKLKILFYLMVANKSYKRIKLEIKITPAHQK